MVTKASAFKGKKENWTCVTCEVCKNNPGKSFLHPIIDFSTAEVWEYIHKNKLPYCKLYDEGFKRLGCVLCPMQTNKKRALERFPKICAAWYRAGERRYIKRPDVALSKRFPSYNEQWKWWLSGKGVAKGDCQGRFV